MDYSENRHDERNSKMSKHKWGIGRGGGRYVKDVATGCIKCGCVKQWVRGVPTYFIDDAVYLKAKPCDERLLK